MSEGTLYAFWQKEEPAAYYSWQFHMLFIYKNQGQKVVSYFC